MSYLETLQELAESRSEFLRHVALFGNESRDSISQQFFFTEGLYLSMMQTLVTRNSPVSITFPIINAANFMDAVMITPTNEQIAREIEEKAEKDRIENERI